MPAGLFRQFDPWDSSDDNQCVLLKTIFDSLDEGPSNIHIDRPAKP
jgi:hypothetical protein